MTLRRFPFFPLTCTCLLLLAACDSSNSRPRTSDEIAMFSPVSIRLHPAFTLVKDLSGNGIPDGFEAVVEFDDRFGDPTRAAGTVLFELYDYRAGFPDDRGVRLVDPWPGKILTVDQQKAHWDVALRAYSFELAYPAVRTDRDYVLHVTYDPGPGNGPMLFAQTIINSTKPRSSPVTRPISHEPSTSPVSSPR
jgi:hypothetical protein